MWLTINLTVGSKEHSLVSDKRCGIHSYELRGRTGQIMETKQLSVISKSLGISEIVSTSKVDSVVSFRLA